MKEVKGYVDVPRSTKIERSVLGKSKALFLTNEFEHLFYLDPIFWEREEEDNQRLEIEINFTWLQFESSLDFDYSNSKSPVVVF